MSMCTQAFTKLLGLKLAQPADLDPATLESPPFPAYTVPLSSGLTVQQLRPYFVGRTFTDTDVGYAVSGGCVFATSPYTPAPDHVEHMSVKHRHTLSPQV
jgi:hypothetical protein